MRRLSLTAGRSVAVCFVVVIVVGVVGVACTDPPGDDCTVAVDCRDGEVCVEGVCKKSEVVFLNAGGEGEGEGEGEGDVVGEGEGEVAAPTARLTADVTTVDGGNIANKFYVDPIYAWCIVRPLDLLAAVAAIFDRTVIDGAVDAIGGIPGAIGGVLRRSQSGLLQRYALAGVLGVLSIVVLLAWQLRG
jgi:hypothetical protein